MDWPSVAQYVELCLGFILVAKLLSLRLHRVYRYFCVFLLADISGILIWYVQRRTQHTSFHFDYRLPWLALHIIGWVFTLLTVYALLDAILANLPGILKLSHRVLNLSFGAAVVIGLLTAFPEYRAAIINQTFTTRLAHVIAAAFVLDRVIASVALIALLCILLFLMWFPVELSRNLAIFFSGFVVYFALKVGLMISLTLQSVELIRATGMSIAILSIAVFSYWAIFISRAGESVRAKLNIGWWHPRQEQLLVAQLEAVNASLLRAVRR
ncbi:MAG TPA: hypothetical protein VFA65_17985 [Bryobacteraceae bacterium]|nr:hypothetical protein [Bryobacteraceae bacterium]